MFRRLVTTSAVVIGAALVATGCSPVKVGSAAIVGSQRITIAKLDTDATNLSQTAKQYQAIAPLSQVQVTQQTLTWLIRFQVNDELARQAGITVSTAQAQKALDSILAQATSAAQAQGIPNVTADLILVANGIPPNLREEVGRYQAIDDQFLQQANGSQAQLTKARCVAAKSLNIKVNPQFGQLNYNQIAIVTVPSSVSRPAGPAKATSQAGLSPNC